MGGEKPTDAARSTAIAQREGEGESSAAADGERRKGGEPSSKFDVVDGEEENGGGKARHGSGWGGGEWGGGERGRIMAQWWMGRRGERQRCGRQKKRQRFGGERGGGNGEKSWISFGGRWGIEGRERERVG
uniref:Uncharacterized protein n=1 Tax=Oryza glaberrima TaxID=4538 RepID=I1R0B7_ORYGL